MGRLQRACSSLERGDMTPQQRRFVAEYLKDLNGTQAAVRAGYSVKTANEQAARLLANVSIRTAAERALRRLEGQTQLTAIRLRDQVWKLATFNPADAFRRDGRIKTWAEMPPELCPAIARLDYSRRTGRPTRIKFIDRLRMLELSVKLLGLN